MKLRHFLTATAIATIILAGLSVPVLAGKGHGPKGPDAAAFDDFGPGPEGPGGPHGHRGPGGPGGPEGGHGGPGGPGMDRRAMMPFWEHEEITADMKLTDEQTKLLAESHAIAEEVLEGHRDTVKAAGEALRTELEKDAPDAAAVKKLAADFANEREVVAQAVLEHVVHVKNILSEDQEKELRKGARKFGREKMEELGELRGEIRDILEDGGTIDDVKALLAEKEVPERLQKMIVSRVEERLANKE